MIPILEDGLRSSRADQRKGVCIGLSEIIASTSREMVSTFVGSLVPTIRKALHDPLPEVREAAAKTFDSLHSSVGTRALDEILPPLLKQLSDPVLGESTLDGLRQMMAIKSRVVLPYILPHITDHQPVNVKALALLAPVAGEALSKHLTKILPAILLTLSKLLETKDEKREIENCKSVILSVTDEQGTMIVVEQLLQSAKHGHSQMRRAAMLMLNAFCHQPKHILFDHIGQLLRGLILMYSDSTPQVLELAWGSLNCITRSLDAKETIECIGDVRNAIRYAISDCKASKNFKKSESAELLLPGFCSPQGFAPILPIYREAIINGPSDKKELAAASLCEVIDCSSIDAVEASTMKIAGTVIRILYECIIKDRHPWNVKIALLETLIKLMSKVGPKMRPFIPQCEQTLRKLLTDAHRTVRLRAADALSKLILISDTYPHQRSAPIFTELHRLISAPAPNDSTLRQTHLHALRLIMTLSGSCLKSPIRNEIVLKLLEFINNPDQVTRVTGSACLGCTCKWLTNEEFERIARIHLLVDETDSSGDASSQISAADSPASANWIGRHGRSVAMQIAMSVASDKFRQTLGASWIDKVSCVLVKRIKCEKHLVVISALKTATYFMNVVVQCSPQESDRISSELLQSFCKCMNHSNNDIKHALAICVSYLARQVSEGNVSKSLPMYIIKAVVPALVNGSREKNTAVKLNSEQALVNCLLLDYGDQFYEKCLEDFESGPRESLRDCYNRVLKRVSANTEWNRDIHEFDDTLLS